jgi:hypothetical protein
LLSCIRKSVVTIPFLNISLFFCTVRKKFRPVQQQN